MHAYYALVNNNHIHKVVHETMMILRVIVFAIRDFRNYAECRKLSRLNVCCYIALETMMFHMIAALRMDQFPSK